MNETLNEIHQIAPWLENLPYNWEPLVEKGKILKLKKHSRIFEQYDKADYVYVIIKGRVRLYLTSPSGEEKALAIIGKGGLVGDCGLFEHGNYTTSAITASEAILCQVSIPQIREELRNQYWLMEQLLFFNNRKYRLLSMQSLQLSYSKAVHRICVSLIQLALNYGTSLDDNRIKLNISFTHQELANLVGTTRVTAVKTLRWLEENQYIYREDKKYVINDLETLIEIINDEEIKII
jgi:CRP-like cAMP-binding protein